ncbi:transporter suffix domain-containing protein [Peribacillus sp. Hz7]|uniref:transporter suffix domain-containing protein n=1 Tax=Peribacillus sp. Hz7 TaxID=3344873 RepID=UPI0035CA141F
MDKEASAIKKEKKSIFYKIGIGLIIISLLSWLIPIIVPFTPLSTKLKAGIITGGLIFAEVMFWGGALLVGKEVAAKFKSYLNPRNWKK